MLKRLAGPVECPIDEGRRYEHDRRVRQHDAPVRENPLVEVARHEVRKPGGVIVGSHDLVLVLINNRVGLLLPHPPRMIPIARHAGDVGRQALDDGRGIDGPDLQGDGGVPA